MVARKLLNIKCSIHCFNFYARSRKLGKAPISFGMSVYLSVRFQLDRFSLNLTLYMKMYILLHFLTAKPDIL